jgi:hypothetical protein
MVLAVTNAVTGYSKKTRQKPRKSLQHKGFGVFQGYMAGYSSFCVSLVFGKSHQNGALRKRVKVLLYNDFLGCFFRVGCGLRG